MPSSDNQGYVKLYRSYWSSRAFKTLRGAQKFVPLYLVSQAAHDVFVSICHGCGADVRLVRGQVFCSATGIASRLGGRVTTVSRTLEWLRGEGDFMTLKSSPCSHGTVYAITNYEAYQGSDNVNSGVSTMSIHPPLNGQCQHPPELTGSMTVDDQVNSPTDINKNKRTKGGAEKIKRPQASAKSAPPSQPENNDAAKPALSEFKPIAATYREVLAANLGDLAPDWAANDIRWQNVQVGVLRDIRDGMLGSGYGEQAACKAIRAAAQDDFLKKRMGHTRSFFDRWLADAVALAANPPKAEPVKEEIPWAY